MANSDALAESERTAALDAEVAKHVRKGYWVTARTPTTAQLVKPKGGFSPLVWSLWVLMGALPTAVLGLQVAAPFWLPSLVYPLWHLTRRDRSRYLTVDDV